MSHYAKRQRVQKRRRKPCTIVLRDAIIKEINSKDKMRSTWAISVVLNHMRGGIVYDRP